MVEYSPTRGICKDRYSIPLNQENRNAHKNHNTHTQPILAQRSIYTPPENLRKPSVFWRFQGA